MHIWDLHEEREIKRVAFKGKVETLALNASGTTLALCAIDHQVRVFDLSQLSEDILTFQVKERKQMIGGYLQRSLFIVSPHPPFSLSVDSGAAPLQPHPRSVLVR